MEPGWARLPSTPTWSGRRWRRWPKAPGSPPDSSGPDERHHRPLALPPIVLRRSPDSNRDVRQEMTETSGIAIDRPRRRFRTVWTGSVLRPITAFRPSYLPVVMVYFAYGSTGLIDVTR